jgi:hypothetical protein
MKRESVGARSAGLILMVIASVLSGCGGSMEAPTRATNLTLTPGIKEVMLSWTPGTGATEFHVLFDPDGQSQFQQVGSSVPGTTNQPTFDVAVHRMDWPKAQFAIDACNSVGCKRSDPVAAMPLMLGTIGYFKASNTDAHDGFGYSVALSGGGNTLAVGTFTESSSATGINGNQSDNSAGQSGAVYLY